MTFRSWLLRRGPPDIIHGDDIRVDTIQSRIDGHEVNAKTRPELPQDSPKRPDHSREE